MITNTSNREVADILDIRNQIFLLFCQDKIFKLINFFLSNHCQIYLERVCSCSYTSEAWTNNVCLQVRVNSKYHDEYTP